MGLNNLNSIGGEFHILSNDSMTSLNGMDIITSIGGNIRIINNKALTNLTGLESLDTVKGNFYIYTNSSMTSLIGIDNVVFIENSVHIEGNEELLTLTGLNNLNSIGGDLLIEDNHTLYSIRELSNVNSIDGYLDVSYNDTLTSLLGLENINANSISWLHIRNNMYLSVCEVESVCDYLDANNENFYFFQNASGCNSHQEVEDACAAVSIDEIFISENPKVHPTPFTISTTLSYELKQPETVQLSVFNQLGQLVYQHSEDQTQGKQQLHWKAQDQPEGLYFYQLHAGDKTANGKLVKAR